MGAAFNVVCPESDENCVAPALAATSHQVTRPASHHAWLLMDRIEDPSHRLCGGRALG
jgi:hypothetical protein